ncbi:hypothetical protein QL996_13310 [Planococcus sp. APC 4015]|nr:hypothetical protein [Planococcus sp. APC 4015]
MSLADVAARTRVSSWVLRAHQKLPDDLSAREYAELVSALAWVCEYATGTDAQRIERARYGSPFEVVVSVTLASVGVLVPISVVVKNLSAARKSKEEGRLARAEADAARDAAARSRADWEAAQEATSSVSGRELAEIEHLKADSSRLRSEAVKLAAEARYAQQKADKEERLTTMLELDFEERRRLRGNSGGPSPSTREVLAELATQLAETDPSRAQRLTKEVERQIGEVGDGTLHGLARAIGWLADYEMILEVEEE